MPKRKGIITITYLESAKYPFSVNFDGHNDRVLMKTKLRKK
jgi:hypothetical protein